MQILLFKQPDILFKIQIKFNKFNKNIHTPIGQHQIIYYHLKKNHSFMFTMTTQQTCVTSSVKGLKL